jgi:curved DNA-binding protein CbpA
MSKSPLTPAELAKIDSVQQNTENGTLYGLLGLDSRASREDVESAYREYVRDWHPDRFFSRDAGAYAEQIENNFVEVTRAYKTLRDAGKRAVYDADLRQRGITVAAVGGVVRDERVGFEVRLERGGGGSTPRPTVTPAPPPRADVNRTVPPAARAPAAAPRAAPPPPEPARAAPPAAVARLRGQIAEQFGRARAYFDAGVADFEAGRYSKAESSFYLAMRYDARNPEFQEYFRRAQTKAKQGRAAGFIALGQQAEQFGNILEALTQYRHAVECEPDEGLAYAKLAVLLRASDEDARECLALLRKAVHKEPRRPEFRVALAELYIELNMHQNAARELAAALEADPKNERARALKKQLPSA